MALAGKGFWIAIGLVGWLCQLAWSQEEHWRLLAYRLEAVGVRRILAEGNAEVQLGTRRLLAQRIEVDLESGWIVAEGEVALQDEEGMFTAEFARVNLRTRQGELRSISGEVRGVLFTAQSLQLNGSLLDMRHVVLTTCHRLPAEWRIVAQRLSLNSALRLDARQVALFVGNTRVVSLPRLSRQIGSQTETLTPRFGYTARRGARLGYEDLLSFGEVRARYVAAISQRGPIEAQIGVWRRLDASDEYEPIPSLAVEESAPATFLESLSVSSWMGEPGQRAKISAGIALRLNTPVENLQRTDLLRSGAEGVYQILQPWVGGTVQLEGRIGHWREYPTRSEATRIALQLRWQSPLVRWQALYTDVVVEGRAGRYGRGLHYTWTRLQWGVYWQAAPQVQLGAGLLLAEAFGYSPFAFDSLETTREVRMRLGIRQGWRVDLLARWDLDHRRWYDWQIAFSPSAHCIQPQIAWSSLQRQWRVQLSLVTRQ